MSRFKYLLLSWIFFAGASGAEEQALVEEAQAHLCAVETPANDNIASEAVAACPDCEVPEGQAQKATKDLGKLANTLSDEQVQKELAFYDFLDAHQNDLYISSYGDSSESLSSLKQTLQT